MKLDLHLNMPKHRPIIVAITAAVVCSSRSIAGCTGEVTPTPQTGLKGIDALIPIGNGQRELILGDRRTGKTAIALDAILNQSGQDVVCVYFAIGQRASSRAKVVATLRAEGALEYTVVMVAQGNQPPGLEYVTPYAATSIAEHFMEAGRDVLIVYDDLTHYARAYRELSLLLRRSPGREAFPGDIFYIHSRMLERSTHWCKERGGGSLAALPIIETEAEDISAYIPTNLISITDGQIYLSRSLFDLGVPFAVDVGKSVSRVGGKSQLGPLRAVAGDLKLAYAQFEELATFSRLGAHLDDATRKAITHGQRIRACLKRPQFDPATVPAQIARLLALTADLFDSVLLPRLVDAQRAGQDTAGKLDAALCERLVGTKKLSDEDRTAVTDAARAALKPFLPTPDEKSGEKASEELNRKSVGKPGRCRHEHHRATPRRLSAAVGRAESRPLSDGLAALRRKITSAGDLHAVVRTMKALAASSIGDYKRSVLVITDYDRMVLIGQGKCFRQARADSGAAPEPVVASATDPIGAIVFGSDQGLVGPFNEVIADHAVGTLSAMPGCPRVWAVGERVGARRRDAGVAVLATSAVPGSVEAIAPLAAQIQIDGEVRRTGSRLGQTMQAHVFHNRPIADSHYKPVSQRLLPIDASWQQSLAALPWLKNVLPEVMDHGAVTLRALIREYLFITLLRACAESLARENASRLAAMEHADRNIKDLLEKLRSQFHQHRQSAIDEELFDVAAGYEALTRT